MGTLPFIPPSSSNFIYDPFSIDFENPFEKMNQEEFAAYTNKKQKIEDIEQQF